MKRVTLFLAILISGVAALITTTIVGSSTLSTPQQIHNSWNSQMWGGMGSMMEQNGAIAQAAVNPWLPYFGVLVAVLIAVIVVGVVGMGYYLARPQGLIGAVSPQAIHVAQPAAEASAAYDSVTKTLTEEERKVIDILNAHEGKYLQKYIKSETGLSRLKTHRIVTRLAERGIVSLEKTGNTNQVYLANWLTQKS